ncbi:hypothetical protein AMATHDRAFT_61259 [Amanita thiersii Skay4041]|uniref:SH3 domain-containing protein n=1 Tax=Amanita thiersii Skay4041 TaxID=703135 RepID=A0A2A9NH61_9AGAR|nr:hypothetical protein AMATHDRAFT_61259 [Amanita thiersii Skay4041]
MVFANLQSKEKDAFFSLLDEYFQSRPEIFSALSGGQSQSQSGNGNSSSNPREAAQRAFSAVSDAASRFGSSGSGHSGTSSAFGKRGGFAGAAGGHSGNTAADDQNQEDQQQQPMAGRVAAAAMAFSSQQPPPKRAFGSGNATTTGGSAGSGAQSAFSAAKNKLGDMDTSSLKSAWGSLRAQPASGASPGASANKAAAPPPIRRAQPEPEPEPQPEEEETQGEWAEALYDYASGEAGDLDIKEGQHVLVTDRTSDDWWTGEVDGKSGLFPASYVKLL